MPATAKIKRPVQAEPEVVFDSELLKLSNVSEELIHLLEGFFRQLDRRSANEFMAIARDIAETRSALRRLGPQQMGEDLPAVGAELDAITRDTESATNTILEVAEGLMELDASDAGIKDKADDLVMRIFEACSFQDLIGQRVSKVVRVLEQIETRISRIGQLNGDGEEELPVDAAEQRRRDLILHGPAIGGPETSQSQVDAYFN